MDKLPKRRVLSLSLSQPSKQQKKFKSKRHVSASSERDVEDICIETVSNKREGSKSPIIKSHNQSTRGQSSNEERELPTTAQKNNIFSQESPELEVCDGMIEVMNVCKSTTQSELCGVNPEKTTTNAEATISSVNHCEVEKSVECGPDIAVTDIEILQCPLCHKIFEKILSKTTHLKSCASKRKLPTHQLIEILELQKRQAAERRALGLPDVHPVPTASKKPVALKKENRKTSKLDSNLQLAMALSLSMQDQKVTLEHSNGADCTKEKSLDRFGFTSKSVLEAVQSRPNVPSRGKSNATEKKKTILLTRTSEERQQIITEKVAMVLLEETEVDKRENVQSINLKSSFLQEMHDKENLLWSKAYTSPSKNDRASYYVQSLQGFISPSKVEMGSKVMHLSQVVGRVKTPPKAMKAKEYDEVVSSSLTEEDSLSEPSSPLQNESKNPAHIEMKLRAKLFNDWAGMVNNATMSDLTIYPQEGREIPTHKLILSVRCPRILKDISKQCNSLTGNQVEVIMWSKTPHAAALAFLEYVYCGSVKSIRVLSGDLSSVTWLATHYKISDLLQYLCAVKEETTIQTASQVALNVIRNMDQTPNSLFDFEGKVHECEEPPKNEIVPILEVDDSKPSGVERLAKPLPNIIAGAVSSRSETDSIYSEVTALDTEVRSLCSSPDLFGDDEAPGSPDRRMNLLCSNDVQTETLPTNKLSLNSDAGITERPPSAISISSEKTVVCENLSSNSLGSSIANENNDVLEKSPSVTSPASSFASAETEVLDCDKYSSKKLSLLSNESKRKLSNSSLEGDKNASKRLCHLVSEKDLNAENTENHVDFFDLTQDSDSSSSPANPKENKSLDSCDKVIVSSDSDSHFHEASKEQNSPTYNEDKIKEKSCSAIVEESNGEETTVPESVETVRDAYVSPVWDGFEDLNYDDPFIFSPQPLDMNEQYETPITSNSQNQYSSPDANSPPKMIYESKRGKAPIVERSSQKTPQITANPSTSSGFDALLDDSLNINDTLLQQAEHVKLTQRDTRGTPVNRILSSIEDTVTPLANYSAMKTPDLKRELQKFGLKPTLGKRKGKIMLRHIYNELHPWVPETTDERFQEKCSVSQPADKKASLQTNSRKLTFSGIEIGQSNVESIEKESEFTDSDTDSDSDQHECSGNTSLQDIKFMEDDLEEEMCSQVPQSGSKNLPKIVYDFIKNDSELHQQVLEYEPIWIEKLQTDLRSNGHKFKMDDLMSFLDEKCITFRTSNSGSRVKKRNQKTSKKQMPVIRNSDSSEVIL